MGTCICIPNLCESALNIEDNIPNGFLISVTPVKNNCTCASTSLGNPCHLAPERKAGCCTNLRHTRSLLSVCIDRRPVVEFFG